jgi:hypothetical protein
LNANTHMFIILIPYSVIGSLKKKIGVLAFRPALSAHTFLESYSSMETNGFDSRIAGGLQTQNQRPKRTSRSGALPHGIICPCYNLPEHIWNCAVRSLMSSWCSPPVPLPRLYGSTQNYHYIDRGGIFPCAGSRIVRRMGLLRQFAAAPVREYSKS